MGAKVTFNEITKIIEVDEAPDVDGEVFIDVKTDLYSDGKEDWVANENLRKFRFPISAVGGNPLPGEKALGSTFFLASDWKIRPYNASHRLTINGNLYAEDGSDPFLDTIGTHTVRIMQQVSSLVDSTVAQLEEIEYASFGGGITVDVTSPYSGTNYPVGTAQAPVNNITDAHTIAVDRGFSTFYIIGDITITELLDLEGHVFVGESMTKSTIVIDAATQVSKCEFYDAHIQGTLDGENKTQNCLITNLNYLNGVIEQCMLGPGTITLGGSATAHFLDCWSGVPGTSTPIIDMGGSGQSLGLRNYNGGIALKNKSGIEAVSIDLNSGQVILENTVTNGDIVIRGVGKLTDNSVGANVLDEDLLNPDNISDNVWDEVLTGATHNIPASAGRRLRQLGDVVSSSVNDVTASNLKFITNLTNTYPDFYKDQLIRFTTGNLAGHVRVIAVYDEVTKEITVEEPMVDIPANGDEFDIIPTHTHPMTEQADTVWEHTTGLKLLGLVQENFVMDQQVYQDYNGAKLLTSARIRTYQDNAKTQLIATYQVTAAWSSGQCTSYEMLIV